MHRIVLVLRGLLRQLLAVLLAGCATQPQQWPREVKTVYLGIEEVPRGTIIPCNGKPAVGCATVAGTGTHTACAIVIPEPDGFDDRQSLEIAGEELHHCLRRHHP